MNEAPTGDCVERMSFVGERKDFARIVWRGTGLELLTAGFYRFWLATRMRRHLWSHTVIAGDSLEYTGKARDLLIGFFFALAILAPFYLFYFLAGLIAESLTPFASTPLVVAFYFLSLFAAFRARRYRLQRTVWRGVRFGMGGSTFGYVWRAALWGGATILTLGLALPWREAALERYKMRFTHYGNLQGSFVGTSGQLFKAGWWLWLGPVTAIGFLIAIWLLLAYLGQSYRSALVTIVAIGFCCVVPFWWATFRARMWRWRIGGMRFGEVSIASHIQADDLSERYWAIFGWSLLIVVLWIVSMLFVLIPASSQRPGGLPAFITSPAGLAIILASYVLAVLFYNIVLRMNIIHDIWQRVVQSITISGLDAVQSLAVAGESGNAMGEGLSDGLDIGGF